MFVLPILFSLFIDKLALNIISDGKHCAIISFALVRIFVLLFADNIKLLSQIAIGFQISRVYCIIPLRKNLFKIRIL